MQVGSETVLNVFPGSNECQRLVLVRSETAFGGETLLLRQESHSPDVGWFVQSCVTIDSSQAAALKMSLSPNSLRRTSVSPLANGCGEVSPPQILRFEEMAAKQAS